jgi:hypothetical protein
MPWREIFAFIVRLLGLAFAAYGLYQLLGITDEFVTALWTAITRVNVQK